jgi:hypothetical protein
MAVGWMHQMHQNWSGHGDKVKSPVAVENLTVIMQLIATIY